MMDHGLHVVKCEKTVLAGNRVRLVAKREGVLDAGSQAEAQWGKRARRGSHPTPASEHPKPKR